MENASKALIIAGAILISLLIISLGILIYNQAKSAGDANGMTKAEIQTFNNDYISYEGTHQKGSVVKDLVQKVNINNKQDDSYIINIEGVTQVQNSDPPTYQASAVFTTHTYSVTCESRNSPTGRIDTIVVQDNANQNP